MGSMVLAFHRPDANKNVMSITTLAFDFGNVIAFFDHRRATSRLVEHTEMPLDEMHAFLFGGQLEDDYESRRISSEEFIRRVIAGCRLRCSADYVKSVYVDIFWANNAVCRLIPLLKPRYRLVLGSNTTELHSHYFLRQFADTLGLFDAHVLSHRIRTRKPEAAFYEEIVRQGRCQPHECVFIDDLTANVAGARACGLHGILYSGGDDLRQRLAELGVQTSDEAAA